MVSARRITYTHTTKNKPRSTLLPNYIRQSRTTDTKCSRPSSAVLGRLCSQLQFAHPDERGRSDATGLVVAVVKVASVVLGGRNGVIVIAVTAADGIVVELQSANRLLDEVVALEQRLQHLVRVVHRGPVVVVVLASQRGRRGGRAGFRASVRGQTVRMTAVLLVMVELLVWMMWMSLVLVGITTGGGAGRTGCVDPRAARYVVGGGTGRAAGMV